MRTAIASPVCAAFAALILSCACRSQVVERPGNPPVIQVDESDLEMDFAIAEARRRLPEFRAAFAEPGQLSYYVKRPFTEAEHTEHIWVEVTSIAGDTIRGKIGNEPDRLTDVALGDATEFQADELTDWYYVDEEEVVHGGFSVPLLDVRQKLVKIGDTPPLHLVVGDVLPVLQRVLELESIRSALQKLPQDLFGGIPPASLPALLTMAAPEFPVSISLESAPSCTTDLALFMRFALGMAAVEATSALEPDPRARVGEVFRSGVAAIHEFEELDLRMRIVARNERTADSWFDQLAALAAAPPPGFRLTVEDTRVAGDLIVAETMLGQRVADALRNLGFPAEVADTYRAIVDEIEVPLRATLDGSALVLEFGTPPAPRSAQEAAVAPEQLATGEFDFRTLSVHFETAIEPLNEIYEELCIHAPEFVDRMDRLEERIGRMRLAARGSVSETERGFSFSETYAASPYEVDSVSTEPLWTVVPDDATLALLDGEDPLDFFVDSVLGDFAFELQMATELYDGFAPLSPMLDYLSGEDSSVFYTGTVLIGRPTADGGRGYALVGVPQSTPQGLEFSKRVIGALVGAIAGAQDGDARLESFEVAEGVSGMRVSAASLGLAADAWPGGFVPHAFAVEDFLIWSTNLETSRLIIERINADSMSTPDGIERPEDLTYVWRVTGDEFDAMNRGLATTFDWLTGDVGLGVFRQLIGPDEEFTDADLRSMLGDEAQMRRFAGVLATLGPIIGGVFDAVQDTYALDGRTLHRTLTIDLSK